MKFSEEFYKKMIAELEKLYKENSRGISFEITLRKTIDILQAEILWNKEFYPKPVLKIKSNEKKKNN